MGAEVLGMAAIAGAVGYLFGRYLWVRALLVGLWGVSLLVQSESVIGPWWSVAATLAGYLPGVIVGGKARDEGWGH